MWIKILRYIDKYIFALLNIILFPLKYIFNNDKYKISPKKVLVIRLWALWSSILTFPMVVRLKKHYWKNVEYSVLSTSRNIWVYKNQWYFDNYLNLFNIWDLLKLIFSFKKYDVVIDTEDYFNISSLISLWTWKINIWYNEIYSRSLAYNNVIKYNDREHASLGFINLLVPLGVVIDIPNYLESYKYNIEDKNKIDEFLFNIKGKYINTNYKIVCFHTWWAETGSDRFWDLQNWIELINKLKQDKVIIFLSGTKFEEKWVLKILEKIDNDKVMNICWKFNLREFAYFLEKCDLMVSNDTWPMHLSACMKTRTIWLFWPNLPIRFWAYPLDMNVNLYKWDWNPTINVHKGEFRVDRNNFVNNISVGEVYDNIINNI